MPSPKSSVGSKSSSRRRNIHHWYYQQGTAGVFSSSWIRRLHLTPTPSPPSATVKPAQMAAPLPVGPDAVNSLCTTGLGDGPLPDHHTVSTHESRTPTSICSTRTRLFLHRLLKFHEEHPLPTMNHGTCSVTGFGPFQVKSRRSPDVPGPCSSSAPHPSSRPKLVESSLASAHRLQHGESQFQETKHGGLGSSSFAGRDSATALGNKGKFTYHGNSCKNIFFHSLQRMTRFGIEKEKMENNRNQEHSHVPFNGGKLFLGCQSHFNGKSYLENADDMVLGSSSSRRVDDNQHGLHLSPFFPNRSLSKKHDYQGDNGANGSVGLARDAYLSGPPGEAINMGALRVESRWSPPPAPFTAGDQRLHEHVMPVNRWPTTAAVYGVDCISGSRGVTYHASGGDGASGRTYRVSFSTISFFCPLLRSSIFMFSAKRLAMPILFFICHYRQTRDRASICKMNGFWH
ncbi:PREDICTED: uncharacterized protein LOC104586716 [Nelumbo nucifera]|uniref:Uncharacterized protein LOC104586716 n=1 Tax=Nelumbo nucifera TaxID=4432 RepID=A0A1U7YQH5_NELNU|nr:PREDICTED: uncharacterized protein LOC104586716 [Nelumbo nucifera]